MRIDLYKDLYVAEEDHWWHIAKRKFVEMFISKYFQRKKNLILDVGCGTGKNMEEFSHLGTIWGIDIADEALKFCRKRGLKLVKKGEAENLPFSDEMFDGAYALDVLEHVDDLLALREIRRVLKNDGLLIVSVPAFRWLWSGWDTALHHKRRYTKEELEKTLKSEGFLPMRITYIHSFLLIPVYIIRKIKQFQNKSYSSDFQINSLLINNLLSTISRLEQTWINRYDMPFGTSVLCIAQKNTQKSPL